MHAYQDSWQTFVSTQPPREIANRLRDDEKLADAGSTCSLTAYVLPGSNTPKALAIATHLVPSPDLSASIKKVVYEGLVAKLKNHLQNQEFAVNESGSGHLPMQKELPVQEDPPTDDIQASDLTTALQVLHHLHRTSVLHPTATLTTTISTLQHLLSATPSDAQPPTTTTTPPPPPYKERHCYICRHTLPRHTPPNRLYPSLCAPCATFNHTSSLLSTPTHLHLPPTFTALVTGARVNLGYATALRLLRCGARVIASTRYPRDAVARYEREGDAGVWGSRLRVVGADFRCARDAFGLVGCVRGVVGGEWGGGLDLVVNNAAQTLTDGVKKEEKAVGREEELRGVGGGMLVEGGYRARVRGGAVGMGLEGVERGMVGWEGAAAATAVPSTEVATESSTEVQTYTKSSWCQSLFEIPYEDVISAHAVNTFVPLILCRELLPLMGRSRDTDGQRSNKPSGYIVNVSSREGIFEQKPKSSKNGKHVHTNMSKAALNMITETEARTAWETRRVAMNTVDPGYMSAAPEYEDAHGGVRPIGWEDGAGRVLWPVAMGEREGEAIWGRFLKHYGAVHVDPGVGRG